jgi:hypothetical protein
MSRLGWFGDAPVKRAIARAQVTGPLHNSSKNAARNLVVGYVGEEVIRDYLWSKHHIVLKHVDMHDYDFLAPNGKRVEVKTTEKDRDENCVGTRHDQDCDLYLFVRIQWIVPYEQGYLHFNGVCTKQQFMQQGKVHSAGTKRQGCGFVPSTSYRYLPIEECADVFEAAELLS